MRPMLKPNIISRAQWGAAPFDGEPHAMGVVEVVLHHSATPRDNGTRASFEERVRGIQRHHQVGNGWSDVGYHYLIGSAGHIAQGRPLHDGRPVIGAHVSSGNTGRLGVCLLGCFHPSASDDCRDELMGSQRGALVSLLRWLLYRYGLVSQAIKLHRDYNSTACPGDHITEELEGVRQEVMSTNTQAAKNTAQRDRVVAEQLEVMEGAIAKVREQLSIGFRTTDGE